MHNLSQRIQKGKCFQEAYGNWTYNVSIHILLECWSWFNSFKYLSIFIHRNYYSIEKEEETIEFIKEDPNNPNTYKIICAENNDVVVDSNYEIQTNDDTVLEIYEFQDDECLKNEPGVVTNITPIQLTDDELKENIAKLLKTVVDESVLKKFGYMKAPIEKVLSSVIKQCGQSPVDNTTCPDSSSKLRENLKLLFTSVIDDDSIKEMLNNHTIDEVVCHVVKLSETN